MLSLPVAGFFSHPDKEDCSMVVDGVCVGSIRKSSSEWYLWQTAAIAQGYVCYCRGQLGSLIMRTVVALLRSRHGVHFLVHPAFRADRFPFGHSASVVRPSL